MSVVSKLSKFIKTSPKSNVRVEIDIHKLLELLSGPSHIEKINQIRIKRSKGNIAKNLAKWLKGKDKLDSGDVYIIQDLEELLKDISKNKLDYSFGISGFVAQDLAKILTIDGESIECEALVKLLKDKNYRKSIADLLKINNKYITTKEGLIEFILQSIKQNPKGIEDLLNNIDATKLLFNKIDINSTDSQGHILLHHAVECENLEIVNLLVKNGASIDMAMLRYTIEYGNLETFVCFIEAAKSELLIGKKYHELLDHVIKFNRCDIINVLLDNKGRTFLHYAVKYENLEIVKLLIKKGAKLNCVDLNGCTPLNLAIKSRNTTIAGLLIDARAQWNSIVLTAEDFEFLWKLSEEKGMILKSGQKLNTNSKEQLLQPTNNKLNTTMHEPTTDQPASTYRAY